MLQKELAKRLKARYDTKMDGNEWMEVSSDGIPLCRIKYNGQFLSNADQNLSDEYRSKIADIQDEISPITDNLPPSEIRCWRRPTAKRTALCFVPGNRMKVVTRCSGEITRRTMNMSRKPLPCVPVSSAKTACSVRMNRQTFVDVWTSPKATAKH